MSPTHHDIERAVRRAFIDGIFRGALSMLAAVVFVLVAVTLATH